jgi:S1 RNA binding domain
MKVTLTQSQNGRLLKGWILIRIETNDICTQIWSSVVFDPYEELYVWLGQIRDAQFPTRMIIDEEGRGVEFIVEQVSLYKNLPIDLVLGELDPIWYEERRVTLEKTHELSQGIRYWKSTQRQRLFAEARLKTLKIGQLIDGRVNKIKSYGLFVDIGGCSALLHIDNISQNPVENLEKFFQAGDWIRAMIIGVDVERGRVSLSTKDLEPEAGDMLKDLLLVYTNAKPRS